MFFYVLSLLFTINFVNSQLSNDDARNIVFDTPDVSTILEFGNQHIQIDAYRYIKNDKIIESNNTNKYKQLMWVSTGHPTLVKPTLKFANSIPTFQITNEGFYVYVEMLTRNQRIEIARSASSKYGFNVTENQIIYLPLSKFRCVLEVIDNNNKINSYVGHVSNFKEFPLRVDFKAKKYDESLLRNQLKNENNKLVCELASRVLTTKTQPFTLTSKQSAELGLIDDLFEKGQQFAYLTKEQIKNLAIDIYVEMNIYEEYEMNLNQFLFAFIEDFLKQVSVPVCTNLALDDAVKWLKKHQVNVNHEITVKQLKDDLSKILEVKQESTCVGGCTTFRKYIVKNRKNIEELAISRKIFYSGESKTMYGISLTKTLDHFKEDKSVVRVNQDLQSQLDEYHSLVKDEIEWRLNGEIIEPKSISFVKLIKIAFLKKLIFNDVRRHSSDPAFLKKFSLYTSKDIIVANAFETYLKLYNEIEEKLSNRTQYVLNRISRTNDKFQVLTGTAEFDGPVQPVTNVTNYLIRKTVVFPVRYKDTPNVFASLNALDTLVDFRISCNVENITQTSFDFVCKSWPVNKLDSFRFSWISLGNGFNVATNSISWF